MVHKRVRCCQYVVYHINPNLTITNNSAILLPQYWYHKCPKVVFLSYRNIAPRTCIIMYTWSRQQLLELQAAANREALLLNHRPSIIKHPPSLPSPEVALNLTNRDMFLPQSNMAKLHLQETIETLKRQNQEAITNLLARHHYDDIISARNNSPPQLPSRDNYGPYGTAGILMAEHNLFRNNVPLQATARKPYPNEAIQSLLATSERLEKRKQTVSESPSKKHLDVFEAEYADPKPKRPLSAYNLFFQEERQKMLEDPTASNTSKVAEKTEEDDAEDDTSKLAASTDSISEATNDQCNAEESPNKKRKRYEPHRKMSFESMAKTIAKRWKETLLDESKMQRYQEIAKKEKARYVKELFHWKQRRRQRINAK